MCDESPSQLATKIHGNIDECNISKPNLRCTCCICDEYLWQIAMNFHRYSDDCGKILDLFPTNFRRYCDDGFKFKIK